MNGYYTTKTKYIVIGRTVFWLHGFFDLFSFQFGLGGLYGGILFRLGFLGLTIRWRRYDSKKIARVWYKYWIKKEFEK